MWHICWILSRLQHMQCNVLHTCVTSSLRRKSSRADMGQLDGASGTVCNAFLGFVADLLSNLHTPYLPLPLYNTSSSTGLSVFPLHSCSYIYTPSLQKKHLQCWQVFTLGSIIGNQHQESLQPSLHSGVTSTVCMPVSLVLFQLGLRTLVFSYAVRQQMHA